MGRATFAQRRRIKGAALVVFAIAIAGLTGAVPHASARRDYTRTAAEKPCRVGELDRALLDPNPYGGKHPYSVAPTVVGCGRSRFGRVRLVAYEITRPTEFCFVVSIPRLGVVSGGECKARDEAWTASRCPSGFCMGPAFGVAWRPKYGFRATVVSGIRTTSAEAIEVVGKEGGQERRSAATVGDISGHLAARFHQTEPFVVFGAALPCMPPKAFTAESWDGVERVTATRSPVPELFKHPCHPPPPPKVRDDLRPGRPGVVATKVRPTF